MLRAVMDTSVLVAGLRSRSGASHELLQQLRAGHWTLVLGNPDLVKATNMTKIEAQIPDYLARQAVAVAERENVPVDQILALALSAQLAAWHGTDDMETRAKRAQLACFDRIMAQVPDAPPLPGDELPEGDQRP